MSTDAEWLKWLRRLADDEAVPPVVAATKLTKFAVAGMLAALWDAYDEGTPLPATTINKLVEHPGFARVLIDTGWGTPCVGGIEFQVFDRYYAEQAGARTGSTRRAARSRRNTQLAEQADAIYEAYPKRVGKSRGLEQIRVALGKVSFEFLLQRTQEFKESVKHIKRGTEEWKRVPYPEKWYRWERWDDRREDRITAKADEGRPGRVESPEGKYDGL